jgi:hypothetical protein
VSPAPLYVLFFKPSVSMDVYAVVSIFIARMKCVCVCVCVCV